MNPHSTHTRCACTHILTLSYRPGGFKQLYPLEIVAITANNSLFALLGSVAGGILVFATVAYCFRKSIKKKQGCTFTVLRVLISISLKALYIWDFSSDVLVSSELVVDFPLLGSMSLGFAFLPHVVVSLVYVYPFMNYIRGHEVYRDSWCPLLVTYLLLGPVFFFGLDLYIIVRYAFTDIETHPRMATYEKIRSILTLVFENLVRAFRMRYTQSDLQTHVLFWLAPRWLTLCVVICQSYPPCPF